MPVKYAFVCLLLLDASIFIILLIWIPTFSVSLAILSLSSSSSTGVNLLKRGSMAYGDMYMINMLNKKRKAHTKSHQSSGLHWMSQRAANIRRDIMTVESRRDFIKSDIQSPGVTALNPYLFSIL